MTPAQLSRTVLHTVRRAVEDDELCVDVPERVVVRTPPRPGCGDYATNVALRLAQGQGKQGGGNGAALRIAEILRRRLVRAPGIARVDIAAPGFLNITLEATSHAQLVRTVLSQGPEYGRGEGLAGVRVSMGRPDEVRGALVAHVVRGLVLACGGEVVDLSCGGEVVDSCQGEVVDSCGGEVVDGAPPAVRAAGISGRDLLTALGSDAARWALLRPAGHDLPDLDPGRLLSQRESNPLFRVRYAHARARALGRSAGRLGVRAEVVSPGLGVGAEAGGYDGGYDHPAEVGLLALLGDFPRTVEAAARHRAPDRVARHLEATADAFFRFHDACPPLPRGEQKPLAVHRSRLALAEAAGTVLANGLHLLGISAPDHL
ncbi:ArgS-related anticodon-binding protein NrtL [Streptomyces sp. NPDC005322]|uniref:ArgS-related anticodon-binding protein NrtL n=1 Tax=unclassified Streptomyces TaxID=2593676 RepID=UPI0033BC2692